MILLLRLTRILHIHPRYWLKLLLLHLRVPNDFHKLYRQYAEHPLSRHIVSKIDAMVIYDQIRRYRPTHCVELGSGLGTATSIIAMAMEANGHGKITALEQHEWMMTLAEELMLPAHKTRVSFVRADPEVRRMCNEDWTCYQFAHTSADIDFVVVDGPAPWKTNGSMHQEPNGDLVGLLPYLLPGCRVFIDGRSSTVSAYRRCIGDRFRIQETSSGYTLMEWLNR